MHSSRMRTGRSLTVCWSLLPGEVSAPGGSALGGSGPGGGSGLGGICSRGVSAPRGPGPGGSLVLGGGVCSWGVHPSMH